MSDFQNNVEKKGLSEYIPAKSFLILLALCIVLGIILGSFFSWLIFYLEGISLEEILKKDPDELTFHHRNIMRGSVFISQVSTFLIPAFTLVYLTERKNWATYLNLNKTPRLNNISLAIIILLASMPLTQFIFWINKQIPLPELFNKWENLSESAISGLITMESPVELILSLIVMAVIPALGEEFVFRGILQKNLEKIFKNGHAAVWSAAFIFSAFHFQFMGFLPRFFLGLLLGYLFLWTRNLWIPIIGHFIYNGIQVVAAYFLSDQMENLNPDAGEPVPVGITVFSFIFVAVALYAVQKNERLRG